MKGGTAYPKFPPLFWIASGLAGLGAIIIWIVYYAFPNIPFYGLLIGSFLLCSILFYMAMDHLVYRKIKSLQGIMNREIKKLKELEAYRREFIGEVSHELKTPIFAVQGFIHTLLDGAMDDDRVRIKFLKKAMKNADRLSSLVEDLLVITQAESGEMEIKIRKFTIYELVVDVLDSLEYKFTRKNKNITYSILDYGWRDVQVLADRDRIHQVLSNLVDNAIKYGSPTGWVKIHIRVKDEKVYVSVEDNGPGIEEEHLEKIFRRFYRVDKSRSREKGGTGLGLAICKHLMSAHGEQISVASTVGTGTTFTFSLKKAN